MTTEMTHNAKGSMGMSHNARRPAPAALKAALANVEKDLIGGMTILKFAKGDWTYGSTNTEVSKDSHWMVDPFSFIHGFIAWGHGRPIKEVTSPMTEALPLLGPPPPESLEPDDKGNEGKGWQRLSGFSLKCISGPDKGTVARFTTSSDGGRKAIKVLLKAIEDQLDVDEYAYCPIVKLDTDFYMHPDKTVGKVKTPTFEVLEWAEVPDDTAGEVEEDERVAPELEPAKLPPVAKKRVRKPEPAPEPEPEPEEDDDEYYADDEDVEYVDDEEEEPEQAPAPAPAERRRRRS